MSSAAEEKLSEEEKALFAAIQTGDSARALDLLGSARVRVNCLDQGGMSPLDQACFKGDQLVAAQLLAKGASADNRAHHQGYTALMFAALAGKPQMCQALLDAGARPHATNTIGKTAAELAAFTGQHECVSVISSYIGREDVDKVLHPNGEASECRYPDELVLFIHRLTRTHAFHPVRLALDIANDELVWAHRKKTVFTVDRLFERQLRCKQPNEVLSLKLWVILHSLRELLKFVGGDEEHITAVKDQLKKSGDGEEKQVDEKKGEEEEEQQQEQQQRHREVALNFARLLLNDKPENAVRHNEEKFLRQTVAAFPYKQAMLWQTLSKQFATIPFGQPPPAFISLCHCLLGPRFVQTASFCRTCYIPSAKKRCKKCKVFYCSEDCQRFDWPIHRKCCEALKMRREEENREAAEVSSSTEILVS